MSPTGSRNCRSIVARFIDFRSDKDANIVLVGNMCDVLAEVRQISSSAAQAVASKYNIPYFEVSAKNNIGINTVFSHILNLKVGEMAKKERAESKYPSMWVSPAEAAKSKQAKLEDAKEAAQRRLDLANEEKAAAQRDLDRIEAKLSSENSGSCCIL